MPLDQAPGPFQSDYYVDGSSDAVRGALIHQARAVDSISVQPGHVAKIPQSFADDCVAPALPSDPMYVQPKSRFAVKSVESVGALANAILAALQSLCPMGTELKSDSSRMKISVVIPGTVDFKIKFFSVSATEVMVAVRRDAGDWFVFIQLYSAIKKQLRLSGMQVDALGF